MIYILLFKLQIWLGITVKACKVDGRTSFSGTEERRSPDAEFRFLGLFVVAISAKTFVQPLGSEEIIIP